MAAHRRSAHRKPKQRPLTGSAARTAATLALAGAATAGSVTGAGAAPAEPAPTATQVRAKVDRLYHDAEVATEKYNGAKEKAATATRAVDALADEAARRAELREHRTAIRTKLADARKLLDTLTADERAAYERDADARHGGGPSHADRSAGRAPVAAPNSRAAQAIAFAHGAIGKPYVWGATGPNAFDCSGLTQAAWKAAGVSLPRTTYTQINAGARIPRSRLAPGDLVFFYSGISHVGLYIGGGRMIHAPRPGAPVRIAPVDEMPFAGATRVA
ncbi:C40 family peptidase [Streptomyces anulatus]